MMSSDRTLGCPCRPSGRVDQLVLCRLGIWGHSGMKTIENGHSVGWTGVITVVPGDRAGGPGVNCRRHDDQDELHGGGRPGRSPGPPGTCAPR